MRALHPTDIEVAARALLAAPQSERVAIAALIVQHAVYADGYRKRTGNAHPLWGNGTIEAAARALPLAPARSFGDREALACHELMIGAVLRWPEATEAEAA